MATLKKQIWIAYKQKIAKKILIKNRSRVRDIVEKRLYWHYIRLYKNGNLYKIKYIIVNILMNFIYDLIKNKKIKESGIQITPNKGNVWLTDRDWSNTSKVFQIEIGKRKFGWGYTWFGWVWLIYSSKLKV